MKPVYRPELAVSSLPLRLPAAGTATPAVHTHVEKRLRRADMARMRALLLYLEEKSQAALTEVHGEEWHPHRPGWPTAFSRVTTHFHRIREWRRG
jgi:hypothetical protein